MRIGLFTDQFYPQISGVVTSVKMLYEALEAMGHECFIFTATDQEGHEDDPEIKYKNVINFKGIHYPFKACKEYYYYLRPKKFIKIIESYNLDIIHLNTEFAISKVARLASKKLHIPLVHTLHTAWINYIGTLFPHTDPILHPFWIRVMQVLFTKPSYKAATLEILPTKKMLPDLKDYGINGNDFEIMPTGIELKRFFKENFTDEEIGELKRKLNLNNKFIFEYVGRTSREKSCDVLLSAYAKAFKDNDDVRFLLVGGGPVLEDLKAQAKELGIEDKVIFTGLVAWNVVPIYYHLGNVFLNASKTETQGLTYVEALAAELPNLVQNDLCIDGVIVEGFNGYLFDDESELVEKLKYIYEHQDELKKVKENTLPSSLKYSKEEFAKHALAIYKKAIELYFNDPKNKKYKK